jgi:signal transduction histidine kinase
MNGYSVTAIVSIMLLLWSSFFLLYATLLQFRTIVEKRNRFFACLIGAFVILVAGMFLFNYFKSDIYFFQPLPFLLSLFLILGTAHVISRNKELTSNMGIVIVFLFALYATLTINYYQFEKEKDTRKLFAQRLDSRQDHLAEYLFEDEEKKISSDVIVRWILAGNKNVSEKLSRYLPQFYFAGYLSKFDVSVTAYDNNKMPFDSASSPLDYFNRQVEVHGKSTYCDKLFFMLNESGRLTYLALLPIADYPDTDSLAGTLVLRLEAKLMQTSEDFPDLLVSNRVRSSEAEANYSFARYHNGSLIYAYGPFPYSFSPAAFKDSKGDFTFFQNEGYEHLIYRASPSALIIVSKPSESSFTAVSLFSYLLFFFSIIFFIAWFSILLARKKIKYPPNLKQRIRSSILALVMLSFVFIATGTIYYITHKYEQDQDRIILSKLHSLWGSLINNMNVDDSLSTQKKEDWRRSLDLLASNMELDFNLYDENANLFYSSQPKIYEKGLIAPRMNSEALFEMNKKSLTQYVHPEHIGKLNYISAYSPLTNRNGDITGYANLPFLEKQNELNKEISGFLSALITIYVLLLALAVLIALIISSRITQPLLLIQEKLSNIHLGRHNESIEWNRKDEIGELVQEYNRMIGELAISAEKLSRSERESAWREMAKQVAHEIKNPLTPMKLQLQHLQRALKDDTNLERLRGDVERINKMLIEQIDNLSAIATEFSNFANMPRPQNETLILSDTLSSSIHLFSGTPGITIFFHDDNKERKINADRQQMIRLFSNLIKNAMQAIPENKEGRIDVNAQTTNCFHLVSISDNGTGIPEEQRSKIFTPNFTTKTSGMGLGLAIVKSTAEQAGGRVWFETKENEGTTFFVEFPAA